MSTELATTGQNQQVMSFEQVERLSEVMAKSGVFGNWNTKDKVFSIMMIAQAEGTHPAQAMFRYDPIPTKSGGIMARKKPIAMLTDFQRAGGRVEWLTINKDKVEAIFTPPDGTKPLTLAYTWEQAKNAGLTTKDNFKNNPEDMLTWNLVSKALRKCYPIATGLMHTQFEMPEEQEGIKEEKQVTTEPPKPLFSKPNTPRIDELKAQKEAETITIEAEALTAPTPPEAPTEPETTEAKLKKLNPAKLEKVLTEKFKKKTFAELEEKHKTFINNNFEKLVKLVEAVQ